MKITVYVPNNRNVIHVNRFLRALNLQDINYSVKKSLGELCLEDVVFHTQGVDSVDEIELATGEFNVLFSWAYDIRFLLKNEVSKGQLVTIINKSSLVVVDTEMQAKVLQELGISRKKIQTMPYGLILSEVPFVPKHWAKDGKTRFYYNRKWENVYNTELLLEAVSTLVSNGTLPFELVMAGSGTEKSSIKKKFCKLFASGIIYDAGEVNPATNYSYLQKSDFYVSTSHFDGTSVSMLESMAVGTPVIVTDTAQNKEWVEDRKSGFLFKPEDKKSLTSTLAYVSTISPFEYTAIAHRARESVENRANFTANVKLLFNLIRAQRNDSNNHINDLGDKEYEN